MKYKGCGIEELCPIFIEGVQLHANIMKLRDKYFDIKVSKEELLSAALTFFLNSWELSHVGPFDEPPQIEDYSQEEFDKIALAINKIQELRACLRACADVQEWGLQGDHNVIYAIATMHDPKCMLAWVIRNMKVLYKINK